MLREYGQDGSFKTQTEQQLPDEPGLHWRHIAFTTTSRRLYRDIPLNTPNKRHCSNVIPNSRIYANNANRKFCTKYGISTSFVRKGRAARDEPLRKVLRSELSRERATRLEGSFGTQKQHYSLSRIKARNRNTEILWFFFGAHTANAILMIDKIKNRQKKAA